MLPTFAVAVLAVKMFLHVLAVKMFLHVLAVKMFLQLLLPRTAQVSLAKEKFNKYFFKVH